LVDALVTEIELRGRAAPLGSVYIGGGTPSLMTSEQVARLLSATDKSFGIARDAEITIEVNPGPADRGDIAGFAAAGVNRVSIGAQSMDSTELRALGRRHTASDVAMTVAQARAANVRSISVDLLYDVPGQTVASWRDSLNVALAVEPDHVSAYALTLDRDEPADDHLAPTQGATNWRARARSAQDQDRAAEMYEVVDAALARGGMHWYEISNWARAGHESRHNNVYWMGGAWQAVGPGAHAYDGVATRRWNAANLERYVSALVAGDLPPGNAETTTDSQSAAEHAILRLRTAAGIPLAESESPSVKSAVSWALSNQLLERTEGRVRLTVRGRLLSNEVFARLMPDQPRAVA
jgi:putative oxygen-independent coproporphyrinogen III oxidase